MLNKINPELLEKYVEIIKHMALARELLPIAYIPLERERQALHDEILAQIGTTRDDIKFAFELEIYVEKLVNI